MGPVCARDDGNLTTNEGVSAYQRCPYTLRLQSKFAFSEYKIKVVKNLQVY